MTQLEVTSPYDGSVVGRVNRAGAFRKGEAARLSARVFRRGSDGPHMFGAQSADLAAIQDELGEVPLVGFFCNGEILHNRVYGYTGELSLFL
jgi:small ligand-binding sensory domain FIST